MECEINPAASLWLKAGCAIVISLFTAAQPTLAEDPPATTPPAEPGAPAAEPAPGVAPSSDDPTKYPEITEAIELFKKGDYAPTVLKLEEAVKAHPELAPAQLIFAELLLKSGQAQAGKNEIERAVINLPNDPRVYLALGAIALAEGEWTNALFEYDKAFEVAQSFAFINDEEKTKFLAKCYLGRASVYENRKDWANARNQFEAWIAVEPDNGNARQRLARCLFFLGDIEKATAELVQAKKDDEKVAPADSALGSFYAAKNDGQEKSAEDLRKAEEHFKKGIESEPSGILGYQMYAQFLFGQNRTEDAKSLVDGALKTVPDARPLRLMRAIFARHLKDYDQAEAEFEDLLQKSPNDVLVRNELALTLAEQPDPPEKIQRAFKLAADNVRANPRSADLLATLGWVHYRLGNIDQAQKVLQAALQASGQQTRPDLLYYFAHVVAEKGDDAQVKRVLEQIAKTDVPFAFREDARQWLDRLQSTSP